MLKRIDALSRENLEVEAYNFLNKYFQNALTEPTILDLENFIENVLNVSIDYQRLDSKQEILGVTVFKTGNLEIYDEQNCKKQILVNKNTMIFNSDLASNLKLEGRFKFTLAHEIAHWILHKRYFFVDENQISLFDNLGEDDFIKCLNRDEKDFVINRKRTPEEWLEWQADNFASSILMPKEVFLKYYNSLKSKNISNYNIIESLSKLFGVSKQATQIRINVLTGKINPEQTTLF